MVNPLITSEYQDEESRRDKIEHVLNVLLRPAFSRLNLPDEGWQVVAENGGQLQDEVVEVVRKLAKKVSGVITPVRAQDTMLVPSGWEVGSDNPEGQINLAHLDYSFCPIQGREAYVNGDNLLRRANSINAYGSLGFAAALLKAQAEGKEIFPVESRGKHYFYMPRTILLVYAKAGSVAYFSWDEGRWQLRFNRLDDYFNSSTRLVRPRQRATTQEGGANANGKGAA